MKPTWFAELNTQFLFFTGKGGVGKTSLASALGVQLADSGKRVLIVSTDPASNLDEVFGVVLTASPKQVPDVPNLMALNIDPEKAAAAYREKMVAPYRGKLPETVIRSIEEQFSGSCTTEIAAFDEFVRLLSDAAIVDQFDHLIFDTAPTGHTLRLLSLPGAWTEYLNTTTAESSCLGPLAGLQEQRDHYSQALAELQNPLRCTVVLVARADMSSLREAARAHGELCELGISNARLLINAVFRSTADDSVARALTKQSEDAIAGLPASLSSVPRAEIPMLAVDTVGVSALRALVDQQSSLTSPSGESRGLPTGVAFDAIIADLRKGQHGVIMTMGKGGVGKTTVAQKIAVALAKAGERVLLTTTDPAGQIEADLCGVENLTVNRIDAAEEVARYSNEVLEKARPTLDDAGFALLREDLRSPCTEEIAVFRAFAEVVAQGESQFVVIDTAPTGHTILLMDATESYHREVLRTNSNAPQSVKSLLPRLRDPHFTRMVLVTLPERTPVHEAASLERDLRRAGIEPYLWVVNRSFALSGTEDVLLVKRAHGEVACIEEVFSLAERVVVLPWEDLAQ